MADTMPEGTDTIIDGAGVTGEPEYTGDDLGTDVGETDDGAKSEKSDDAKPAPSDAGSFNDKIQSLRGQATDRARDYVEQGRDRVTGVLDELVRMVEEVAGQIDDKVGGQYGDQVRRASGMVSELADTVRHQDVNDLFAQATEMMRKSPAIAAGAAATLGFLVARVIKAGGLDFGAGKTSSPAINNPAAPKA